MPEANLAEVMSFPDVYMDSKLLRCSFNTWFGGAVSVLCGTVHIVALISLDLIA